MAEIQTHTTGGSGSPAGATSPGASSPTSQSAQTFTTISQQLSQLRFQVMHLADEKGPGARQWARIGTALAEAMEHAERGRQEVVHSPGGGEGNGHTKT